MSSSHDQADLDAFSTRKFHAVTALGHAELWKQDSGAMGEHADGRCAHFIVRKQRRCGMMCRKGASLCTEHAASESVGGDGGDGGDGAGDGVGSDGVGPDKVSEDRRVPCPLDPKHTVWESSLRKHLLKCNRLKLRHLNDEQDYYAADCNAARQGGVAGASDAVDLDPEAVILRAIPVLQAVCAAHFAQELPLDVRTNEFMRQARFGQLTSNKKHAVQQSSLIQHLVDRDLTETTSFVEFGCGRAELSRYVNQVVTARLAPSPAPHLQHFVLIDRASNRMKFDKKIADDYRDISGSAEKKPPRLTYRYKIDIKDLKLDPVLKDDSYVAISKHLCGVATDLTLRCIANSSKLVRDGHLQGLCIAMCCRHVCDAAEYVNPDYIRGLVRDYELDYVSFFTALRKICSWATCGRKAGVQDDDVNAHFTRLTVKQRETLGLMARRIVDHGRYLWIRSILPSQYSVELVRYVASEVSLENVAMLVHK